MKTFFWRHNRRYHSWSMFNEPNINLGAYTDAVLIVQAESEEEAYELIAKREEGWVIEELRRLGAKVIDDEQAGFIFSDVRGD